MRGDLKDTIGRGVDDGRAGAHVLLAELLNNFGAGGRLVPENFASDFFFERSDYIRREAVRIKRKRFIENDAGHLPMSGGGIFAGGSETAFAVSAGGGL